MATISSGSVTVTIQPGEQYRVIATGEAYVDIGGGSTQSYRLVNGASERLLGGFIVATPVTIRVISGSVDYINVSGTGDSVALSLAQSSRPDINGFVASTASGDLIGTNGKSALEGKTVSAKVVACIPAMDTLTRFSDVSGLGHHLQVEAANSGAFSNSGYFTTTAAINGGLVIPQSDIKWNPYRESAIFSVVFKRATPATNEVIFALSFAATGMQGFYISHRSNGKLWALPVKNDGSIVTSGGAESTLQFTTATAADVLVTVAYDALTGTWYLWKGKALSDVYTGLTAPGGANSFADVVSNAGLRVGNQFNAATACVAVQGYGLQFSKFEGGLPNNLLSIVNRLADLPRQPISALEW